MKITGHELAYLDRFALEAWGLIWGIALYEGIKDKQLTLADLEQLEVPGSYDVGGRDDGSWTRYNGLSVSSVPGGAPVVWQFMVDHGMIDHSGRRLGWDAFHPNEGHSWTPSEDIDEIVIRAYTTRP